MPIYAVSRARSQLSTTADTLTIVASSTKPLRIIMCKVAGADAAPADNTVLLMKSTGGTGPGTAITPTPIAGNSTASFAVYTTWSGQPTPGAILHRFEPNANGGIDPFVAVPGGEYSVPVSGQVSLRSERGTSNVVPNLLIEEVEG